MAHERRETTFAGAGALAMLLLSIGAEATATTLPPAASAPAAAMQQVYNKHVLCVGVREGGGEGSRSRASVFWSTVRVLPITYPFNDRELVNNFRSDLEGAHGRVSFAACQLGDSEAAVRNALSGAVTNRTGAQVVQTGIAPRI